MLFLNVIIFFLSNFMFEKQNSIKFSSSLKILYNLKTIKLFTFHSFKVSFNDQASGHNRILLPYIIITA